MRIIYKALIPKSDIAIKDVIADIEKGDELQKVKLLKVRKILK